MIEKERRAYCVGNSGTRSVKNCKHWRTGGEYRVRGEWRGGTEAREPQHETKRREGEELEKERGRKRDARKGRGKQEEGRVR